MKKRRISMLLFALLMAIHMNGQGMVFSEKNWEAVLEEAKATDTPIFLDAYTVWCGPCKKMSKYVFTKKSVGDFYNEHFINVKMDMEKGIGVQLAKKHNIRAYPTLLYLSPNGEILHRVAGYHDEAKFLATGKKAMNPKEQLSALTKRFVNGERDPNFLREYAYARKYAADNSHQRIAQTYLGTQKDWTTPKNLKFIYDFADNTASKEFHFLLDNRDKFETLLGKSKVFIKIQSLIDQQTSLVLNQKGNASKKLTQLETLFGKAYGAEATFKFAAFKMEYYRGQGDRDGFAEAAVEYVENMRNITADELNSIARTFAEVIEDKEMLQRAVNWSKRAIKMEKLYAYHYTLAALYYKIENFKKAKKAAKKAIKIAKKTGENTQYVKDLLQEITLAINGK